MKHIPISSNCSNCGTLNFYMAVLWEGNKIQKEFFCISCHKLFTKRFNVEGETAIEIKN